MTTIFAVAASAAALAVAVVALLRLELQRRARAVLVTARVEAGGEGRQLVVEIVNTLSRPVTVAAVWLWLSTDKRHGRQMGLDDLDDLEDWATSSSPLELTRPSLPVEIDAGGWQAWRTSLEPGAALGEEATRGYVKVYLKPGGTTSAPVATAA